MYYPKDIQAQRGIVYLQKKDFFDREWLFTLNDGGTKLPSHPDRLKTPGVDMTTGSLGQGTSAAAGIATGFKMNKQISMYTDRWRWRIK